jgi:hypothetical protein
LFRAIPLVFDLRKQLYGVIPLSRIARAWSHHSGMKPAPTHLRPPSPTYEFIVEHVSMQSDCVATDMATMSSRIQPCPQIVVNVTPRMLERDLKDRYGADASQPDEGCGITRSKTELAGVAEAEAEAEAAGDIDVGEADADADGAAEGFDAIVGVVGQASLPASATLSLWLLLSIALPTNPPIRPAMTARISPYRRSNGQRVHLLPPLLGSWCPPAGEDCGFVGGYQTAVSYDSGGDSGMEYL